MTSHLTNTEHLSARCRVAPGRVMIVLIRGVKMRKCKAINLPVVLYGNEYLSLTLREENRLKEFEDRVLRRALEPR